MSLTGSQCINIPHRNSISYKGSNKMDIYELIAENEVRFSPSRSGMG